MFISCFKLAQCQEARRPALKDKGSIPAKVDIQLNTPKCSQENNIHINYNEAIFNHEMTQTSTNIHPGDHCGEKGWQVFLPLTL